MGTNFNTLTRESERFNALKHENRTIYFDMDGTIADLYAVPNWLNKLEAENPEPYEAAKPLCDLAQLGALCCELQAEGWKIGIISWLSKTSSKNYDKLVRQAKKNWLKEFLPIKFNEIHIVKYGTPKHSVAKDKNGILFDDEIQNCEKWKGMAFNVMKYDIIEILENILDR